jgi:hypothetical protein
VGVFEVDEAWLPLLGAVMRPRLLVLGNLSGDRLGAYGELERLVSLWRRLLRGPNAPPRVVVNADDPLLAGPGGVLDGVVTPSLLYGVQEIASATPHPIILTTHRPASSAGNHCITRGPLSDTSVTTGARGVSGPVPSPPSALARSPSEGSPESARRSRVRRGHSRCRSYSRACTTCTTLWPQPLRL